MLSDSFIYFFVGIQPLIAVHLLVSSVCFYKINGGIINSTPNNPFEINVTELF